MEDVKLDENVLREMKPAIVFKNNKDIVNSLDISKDGRYLVTWGDDGFVNYYDLERGEKINTYIMDSEFGINLIKFTNHNKTVLVATRQDNAHAILYWSLHDNVILAKFMGHVSRILSIEANSLFSNFVSVSNDEEARVWDYNQVEPLALFTEWQAACNDNTGKVLACAHNPKNSEEKYIYLYNMEEKVFDKPFSSLPIPDRQNSLNSQPSTHQFMKFSYDGKYILVTDNQSNVLIIDAFVGGIMMKLSGQTDEAANSPVLADFTPCNQYVVLAMNKKILFWDWQENKEIVLEEKHVKHIHAVRFNTEYLMLASACQNVIVWTPDLSDVMTD